MQKKRRHLLMRRDKYLLDLFFSFPDIGDSHVPRDALPANSDRKSLLGEQARRDYWFFIAEILTWLKKVCQSGRKISEKLSQKYSPFRRKPESSSNLSPGLPSRAR